MDGRITYRQCLIISLNVRDKDTNGTGLGLYIVNLVVKNFGGDIRFESEENKGTVFYVTLPLDIGKHNDKNKRIIT